MLFTGTVSLPIVIATRILIGYPQVVWQFPAFWFAAISISLSHSRIVAPSRFCYQFVLQSVPSLYACACRDVVAVYATVPRHGDAAVRYAGRPAARGDGTQAYVSSIRLYMPPWGAYFVRFLMRMAAIDAADAVRAAGRISTPVWTMSDIGFASGFGSVTGVNSVYRYENGATLHSESPRIIKSCAKYC